VYGTLSPKRRKKASILAFSAWRGRVKYSAILGERKGTCFKEKSRGKGRVNYKEQTVPPWPERMVAGGEKEKRVEQEGENSSLEKSSKKYRDVAEETR